MGYAVEGDIRRHLGKYSGFWPPAGAVPPTVADGLAFADRASGELDGILRGRGIAVPVAAPASFVANLRDLAALYAASLISAGLFPQAAGPSSTTHHEFLMGLYREGLKRIEDGSGIPDDIVGSGSSLPSSLATKHPDTVSADLARGTTNTTDPVFTRDVKW